jgi:putative tryptophan/tyrosine transport system substrate-binding protein
VKRREFIAALGGAAAWPLVARAQSGTLHRIGSMASIAENDPVTKARLGAFRSGLAQLGWIEGRNIQIDYRYAAGSLDKMSINAAELEAIKPEVILVNGAPALAALVNVTHSIPIVFVAVSDPVNDGFVQSLAHPGSNVTGFTDFESATAGKWLQLLRDVTSNLSTVLVASTRDNPSTPGRLKAIETASAKLDVRVRQLTITDTGAFDFKVDMLGPNTGLIVLPSPFTPTQRTALINFSTQNRLTAAFPFRYFATGGGLMSYGVDVVDQYREAAGYVDRILKGESPANLPVQQPTKYELVLNLKTARAIDVEIPLRLQQIADEVIE